MKPSIHALTIGLSLTVLTSAALANPTDSPRIDQRQINQEQRIDQGVASGSLTPREAGRLEAQQARIEQREQRLKSDGVLTAKERARLARDQNRASKTIYRKKHNLRSVTVQ